MSSGRRCFKVKKIQLYVDEKREETIAKFIEHLEEESKGKRGYVQDKIKECIKVFKILSDRIGVTEPTLLVLACIDGINNQAQVPVTVPVPVPAAETVTETVIEEEPEMEVEKEVTVDVPEEKEEEDHSKLMGFTQIGDNDWLG